MTRNSQLIYAALVHKILSFWNQYFIENDKLR